jgi:hypothetical protein
MICAGESENALLDLLDRDDGRDALGQPSVLGVVLLYIHASSSACASVTYMVPTQQQAGTLT